MKKSPGDAPAGAPAGQAARNSTASASAKQTKSVVKGKGAPPHDTFSAAHAPSAASTPLLGSARATTSVPARALSHGCIRAERATELAMTMAILGSDLPPETAVEYNLSGKYTKVPMTTPWPVYVTYFTVARDVNGLMRSFADLYQRDAPVIASFATPRALHTDQRTSNEAVIKLDNPL